MSKLNENQINKLEIEKIQMNQLVDILGLSNCKTNPNESDPPDFILTLDNNDIVGVECTLLTTSNGTRVKRQAAALQRVLKKCKTKYDLFGDKLIKVQIRFAYNGELNESNNALEFESKKLYDLVLYYAEKLEKGVYAEINIPKNELPKYCLGISVVSHQNLIKSNWGIMPFVRCGANTLTNLYETINKKNEKMLKANAQEGFDSLWLLLVCDGSQASEFSDYIPDGFQINSSWVFDRIYLLSQFENKVYNIK